MIAPLVESITENWKVLYLLSYILWNIYVLITYTKAAKLKLEVWDKEDSINYIASGWVMFGLVLGILWPIEVVVFGGINLTIKVASFAYNHF